MKVIYKYAIEPIPGVHTLKIIKGAILRKVDNQSSFIAFWYEVDDDETDYQEDKFFFFLTGDLFNNHGLVYVDSILLRNGSYVVHIYKWLKN